MTASLFCCAISMTEYWERCFTALSMTAKTPLKSAHEASLTSKCIYSSGVRRIIGVSMVTCPPDRVTVRERFSLRAACGRVREEEPQREQGSATSSSDQPGERTP